MLDYSKQIYQIAIIILITTLFTPTMINSTYNSNYKSKQENRIYTTINMFISLDKTPDEIAKSSETAIIHSIEISTINKK